MPFNLTTDKFEVKPKRELVQGPALSVRMSKTLMVWSLHPVASQLPFAFHLQQVTSQEGH
jgi:hypothetical protein